MDTIFVVVHGYDYEGDTILSLCKNKIKANSIMKNYMDNDPFMHCGPWVSHNDTWERGCEYLRIHEMQVEE